MKPTYFLLPILLLFQCSYVNSQTKNNKEPKKNEEEVDEDFISKDPEIRKQQEEKAALIQMLMFKKYTMKLFFSWRCVPLVEEKLQMVRKG